NGGKRDPTRAHSVGTRLDFTRDALGGRATFIKWGSMNWRRARRAAAENGLCWTGVLPGEFLSRRACRFREMSGVDVPAPLRPRDP
ncbi:MAG: hypothetical protein J4N97_11865, partial [Chloroflexi bacterium]|nr:hypothetical protein [Chloroflexota bacterium]